MPRSGNICEPWAYLCSHFVAQKSPKSKTLRVKFLRKFRIIKSFNKKVLYFKEKNYMYYFKNDIILLIN